MGGALFGVARIGRKQFDHIWIELNQVLLSILPGAEFSLVPFYNNKPDFGDMDVLVKSNVDVVRTAVIDKFKLVDGSYFTNDGIFSFLLAGFQIDLICTVNNYETSLSFFSYNDMGNLLGRIYHKLGMKLGHQGLLYPLRDKKNNIRKEIVVSTDMSKILEFIGCDYERWKAGFNDLKDIFEFVATSKYFDVDAYSGEKSAINRKRDAKRTTFSKFTDWLSENKIVSKYTFPDRSLRDQYTKDIDLFFDAHILDEKAILTDRLLVEQIVQDKYNGGIVMEITGLTGPELGKFMGLFKKWMIGKSAGSVLDETSDDEFFNVILNSHEDEVKMKISELNAEINSF